MLNTSTLKSDEQLSNGDQLVNGGVYSVHSEVGQPWVMMNFVVKNLKFLFNLKKKKRKHYEDLLFYVTLGAFLCMSMSVVNHKQGCLY